VGGYTQSLKIDLAQTSMLLMNNYHLYFMHTISIVRSPVPRTNRGDGEFIPQQYPHYVISLMFYLSLLLRFKLHLKKFSTVLAQNCGCQLVDKADYWLSDFVYSSWSSPSQLQMIYWYRYQALYRLEIDLTKIYK